MAYIVPTITEFEIVLITKKVVGGLTVKLSAFYPRDPGFELHMGHDHVSSQDTNTDWFEETDLRLIQIRFV